MVGFRTFSGLCNPMTLIWLIIAVVMLVANSYFSLEAFFSGRIDILAPGFIGMELQLYISSTVIILALNSLEQLQIVNEGILSFLFKYPISKLTTAEAAQVETFITTIRMQKPILRASDIFTVGTRLLASISGTVVTYVLVVLQFRAPWLKQNLLIKN